MGVSGAKGLVSGERLITEALPVVRLVTTIWYWNGRSQLKRLGFRRLPAHGAIPLCQHPCRTKNRASEEDT